MPIQSAESQPFLIVSSSKFETEKAFFLTLISFNAFDRND